MKVYNQGVLKKMKLMTGRRIRLMTFQLLWRELECSGIPFPTGSMAIPKSFYVIHECSHSKCPCIWQRHCQRANFVNKNSRSLIRKKKGSYREAAILGRSPKRCFLILVKCHEDLHEGPQIKILTH